MNRLSANGAEFIRLHEGFRSKWYLDPVGVPTIGIGFTWRSKSFRDWWGRFKSQPFRRGATMTQHEADDALQFLVAREYGKAVNDFLGKRVPQHVYDAMVSAVFNLGPGALRWKWAAAAKRGDYSESARLLRRTGVTAKGKRLPGLVRRRKEEAHLLEKGVYTGVHQRPSAPAKPLPGASTPKRPKPAPAPSHKGFWAAIAAFLRNMFGRKEK